MARRYIPPIPLEIIMDDPRVIALPAAGRGMLNNLVWRFWITDCREMPKSNAALFSIADAHPSTWSKFKPEIMAILAEVAPALIKARELRDKRSNALMQIRERSSGSLALARLNREAARAKAKREPIGEVAPAPRLSETERAARVAPPAVKPKVEGGFSDRRTG